MPKIDFCTRKTDFSKKSTPKGGLNTRHVMEVTKIFLSDMKVQDQFLPWTKNMSHDMRHDMSHDMSYNMSHDLSHYI